MAALRPPPLQLSDGTPPAGERLLGAAEVRRLAAQIGLRPTKTLGQNFVIDANTVRRVVRVAELAPDDVVLEVGPGLGSLTLGLLAAAPHVTAVEIDPRLADLLPETCTGSPGDLTVVCADALRLADIPGPPPTCLVANLPYNVAVPVVLTLLERVPSLTSGLVMVQQEVADRLTAPPGSRVYGAPTVKLAWYAAARQAGSVPRSVFWPVPNVDSGLVAFRRRASPVGADRIATFAVVDAAFAQRRKTLRAALSGWAGGPAAAEAVLRRAEVDPGLRGEALDVSDFARIAAAIPT